MKTRPLDKVYQAVVMGTSAGGINALETILPILPEDFDIPMIIVQHRSEFPENFLWKYLDSICRLCVNEAEDKTPIAAKNIYIAPPGYHLMVEMDYTLALSVDPRVNWARPSIDVLFETAAEVYREQLIGVIMTGANNDGSKGLAKIKKHGGLCIVQSPETAEVKGMPLNAMKEIKVDHVLTLDAIGLLLAGLNKTPEKEN